MAYHLRKTTAQNHHLWQYQDTPHIDILLARLWLLFISQCSHVMHYMLTSFQYPNKVQKPYYI